MSSASTTGEKNVSVAQSIQGFSLQRLVYYMLLALSAVAAIIFVAYLSLALEWRSHPFFGAMVSYRAVVDAGRPTSGEVWAGQEAGLRYLDRIIAIDGIPLAEDPQDYTTAIATYHNIMLSKEVGERITVTVERFADVADVNVPYCEPVSDGVANCTISYTLQDFPDGDFLAYFILPYIAGLVAFGIAIAILRLRPSEPIALIAVLAAIGLSLYMTGIFDAGSTHRFIPVWLLSSGVATGALLAITFTFPQPIRFYYTWRYLPVTLIAGGIALSLIAISQLYEVEPRYYGAPIQFMAIITLSSLLVLFLRQLYLRRKALTPMQHDQGNALLIGAGLALIPAALWAVGRILLAIGSPITIPFNAEATMPFYVLPLMSIAYAVLQYRRFDTDYIISQTAVYTLLLIALIAGYFLLVLGVSILTQSALGANDPIVIALTVFIISALFIPVRTRLQERVDRFFYRARRNYQQKLEAFSQKLTTLTGYEQVVSAFRELLEETIHPTNAFIFLLNQAGDAFVAYGNPKRETDVTFGADSGVATLLRQVEFPIYLEPGRPWPDEIRIDRVRLNILKTMVMVGLRNSRGKLLGFVSLGPPRSGISEYNYDQLRFIGSSIAQLAIAVERAQVVDSLQRRVNELDVLSQVGQAANFTIEFEDLLELISAQTNRLVQAPCFYIALHDPTSDQLYFAFFQEDYERDRGKENKRWSIGNDLFSEVISKRQAIRVENFIDEMTLRHADLPFITHDLRPWMGVPMTAGDRILGVIAIGRLLDGEPFTQEEYNIFNDIGSLAATSLDKARLFNEANARARQLTVLNDISRQMVAVEGDVERLLDLITSSSVEILNAEAGSLLLMAEDGSRDLIFRVAIGGGGEDLVGQRIKAGHGLAGRCADTGEPVIVNETASDPRWEGEAAPEKFRTSSILAVPLIAKDEVIGVLEVVNKRDGTMFVNEDAELLTTFAGQAAIAIENARLFQMTDQQLSQRLKELEVLDRINHELNRTLDLHQVAEITVRWAVANTGAEAGALGIVEDTPPKLHIVAKYGYDEDDTPEGANGDIWPLNKGIVSRVLRTKAPDIVLDVSIDPDYIPSLRRSISQITIPILSGDEVNAILILETNQEPRFSLSDWDFARRLAENAGIAISNAQLYAELTRADESKSEFMAFAAHELKNPLTPIKGYAEMMLKGATGELTDQQKQIMHVLRTNAERMQTIINDLRDIARMDARQFRIELSPIDIYNVVIETLRPFMQQLEEKGQTIVNNVPEGLPLIIGDATRLIQVMTNLVSNAYKYSPPGSTITITARPETSYRTPNGNLHKNVMYISVADNGIGMSEEDLQKIFRERYFRSSNRAAQDQPGTGLGMMITQHIIELHNGEIWVESKLGEGSNFQFVIPLAVEEGGDTPETSPDAATEPASD